jgi:hypothetical protein
VTSAANIAFVRMRKLRGFRLFAAREPLRGCPRPQQPQNMYRRFDRNPRRGITLGAALSLQRRKFG